MLPRVAFEHGNLMCRLHNVFSLCAIKKRAADRHIHFQAVTLLSVGAQAYSGADSAYRVSIQREKQYWVGQPTECRRTILLI